MTTIHSQSALLSDAVLRTTQSLVYDEAEVLAAEGAVVTEHDGQDEWVDDLDFLAPDFARSRSLEQWKNEIVPRFQHACDLARSGVVAKEGKAEQPEIFSSASTAAPRYGVRVSEEVFFSHPKPSMSNILGADLPASMSNEEITAVMTKAGHSMQLLMIDTTRHNIKIGEQEKADIREKNRIAREEQLAKQKEAEKAQKKKGIFGFIAKIFVAVVTVVAAVAATIATLGAAGPVAFGLGIAGIAASFASSAYAVTDVGFGIADAAHGFTGEYTLDAQLAKSNLGWMNWVSMGLGIAGAVFTGGASMATSAFKTALSEGVKLGAREVAKQVVKNAAYGVARGIKNMSLKIVQALRHLAKNGLMKTLMNQILKAARIFRQIPDDLASAGTYAKKHPLQAAGKSLVSGSAVAEGGIQIGQADISLKLAGYSRDMAEVNARIKRLGAALMQLATYDKIFQDILKEINKMLEKYSEFYSGVVKENSEAQLAVMANMDAQL